METITSISNDNIKLLKKLYDKKFRLNYGLFVVEGVTLVKSIPNFYEVNSIFIKESTFTANQQVLSGFSCPEYLVADKVFMQTADTDNPSGIIATVKLTHNALKEPIGNSLILDRISDPGNMGTIIRTAVACRYNDIYMINSADPYSPKAVRASMGGIFNSRIYECSYSELNKLMENIEVLALDMGGVSIYDYVKSADKKIAIAVGNEANGISDDLLKIADKVISLPMASETESLNAAVACGITMYLLGGKR